MSVSSVNSSSAYSPQWPLVSPTDTTDQSGAPTDALISLFQAFQGGGQAGAAAPQPPPADGSSGCSPQFSSDTMSAMISMLGQGSGSSPLDSLVGKFDTDGDGNVSQSEFEQAMGTDADKTKADALFAKIDKNGDGTVSKGELAQAIHKAHGHHHHHDDAQQADGSQGTNPLQALLSGQGADGSTSQSSTNSDGSTTTTVTYADGTKIMMTTPAAGASDSSASGNGGNSGTNALNAMNLKSMIENMIAMQAQMFAQQQTGMNVSV